MSWREQGRRREKGKTVRRKEGEGTERKGSRCQGGARENEENWNEEGGNERKMEKVGKGKEVGA